MTIDRGNLSARREYCATATFATTNPTLTALGWNPRLRGEKSKAIRLLLNIIFVCFEINLITKILNKFFFFCL
jgi:hypothetical protein